MSAIERTEKNKVQLTFTVAAEKFREALQHTYNKNKKQFNIQGFRPGKAPRKFIERMFGQDIFYKEALDLVVPEAYEQALGEHDLEPVRQPQLRLVHADEDSGAQLEAVFYVKPEVSIDGYYGLTYPKMETEPTEADVQEYLQRERDKNARQVSVDRPAENGDVVVINFRGTIDGVPFAGGKAEDFELTLGSHKLIDNFEDQLLGHVAGDDVAVTVTFPEDYGHEGLSGKTAVFQTEILDVKTIEYPEIDDDFAQDVSEFDTLAEYRADIADKIRQQKVEAAMRSKETYVVDALTQKAVMDVPTDMYEAQLDDAFEQFAYSIASRGMDLQMYMEYNGETEESLRDGWRESIVRKVNNKLALEAVANQEGLTVSDEELEDCWQRLSQQSGIPLEELRTKITPQVRKGFINELRMEKALAFVTEHAVAVEDMSAHTTLPDFNAPPENTLEV